MQPTRLDNSILFDDVLAVALELSGKAWKIACHDGKRERPTVQTVNSSNAEVRLQQTVNEIEKTKSRWGLPHDLRTVVLYEAGQDGFWIERALSQRGFEVLICDPASIPVERHARRAKTDRLDAIMLVCCLRAWLRGERDRMHVVHVPDSQDENQRQLIRERGQLQKELTQHRDRIRKLLRTVGCWQSVEGKVAERFARGEYKCHDGTPLPSLLQARLVRECERLTLAQQQFDTLERQLIEQLPAPVQQRIAKLERLRAVGPVGATRLVLELFWRYFDNRRQVGSCVGLVPQPYDSGDSRADQGISKKGNRRVRSLLVEMSWLWLRYQPNSSIALWFNRRTQGSTKNKRSRRIAIVAVARRLVIAFWRYLEHGVIPEGAQLKPALRMPSKTMKEAAI